MSFKGHFHTIEFKENMKRSLSERGHKKDCKCAFCKDHTGNTYGFKKGNTIGQEYRFKKGDNLRNTNGFRKGIEPWNKRLTKETDGRVKKGGNNVSKSLEGNRNNKGKHWKISEQGCKNIGNASKRRWQDTEYKERMIKAILKAIYKSPNKSEQYLNSYLQKILPNEYQFVGNGQFILAGKCPDFLNINKKKKLIELYGEHWHDIEEEQERIDYFKEFGYLTLVVWTKELKELEKLKIKILKFNSIKKLKK